MTDDDRVFKALADKTRRRLLDRLFARNGRTLSDLESEEDMTRFGVMKHLKQLEDAGLVTTRKTGREKLHFLNVVPIRLIHDRWIDKYTEPQVAMLADLKNRLEAPVTHRIFIKAAPQAIWDALPQSDVVEADPPHKLVQGAATYEITPHRDDVSLLTLTCEGSDGDWDEMLSGLKTLLETGSDLYPSG